MAGCESGANRSHFHAGPTDPARRFCCSRLNRKFLREVSLFCRATNLVEIGRKRGRSRNLGCDQSISDVEECADVEDDAVELEQLQEPQNNEGKTSEMSSVTRLVSPR